MDKVTAQKLFIKLGLGTVSHEPERIFGGLMHKMYKVEAEFGKYAVKALNPQIMKREGVLDNLLFAEEIARAAYDNGVPAVPAICNGGCINEIEGRYYLVFEWFDGKKISENEITASHCEKLGKVLANMHSIDYDSASREKRTELPGICTDWKMYFHDTGSVSELLINNQEKLFKWNNLVNQSARIISDDVINHNDMDIKNVLWNKDDNPVIIDWEAAGYSNRLLALINVAADWSFAYTDKFNMDFFSAVITSYIEHGGNTDGNIQAALNYGYKGMMDWLEYSVKRSLGFEINDESEKELGNKQTFSTMEVLINYENNLIEIQKVFNK